MGVMWKQDTRLCQWQGYSTEGSGWVGDTLTLNSRWNADCAESPVGAELVQGREGSRLPLGHIRAAVGAEPSWWEDTRAAGEQPRFRDSG